VNTTPEEFALDKIFEVADLTDGDTAVLYAAAIGMLSECLNRADELGRQRLLRGLIPQLKDALATIPEIMRGSQPYPNAPQDPDKLN
jgi:hypothetical protein